MSRNCFLALLALLCLGVALMVACGTKGATNNYYIVDDDASPDDDAAVDDDVSPDDDAVSDDDDDDDNDDDNDDDSTPADDDDDSTGCDSPGYAACTAAIGPKHTSCTGACAGRECTLDNCVWTCSAAALAAWIACDHEYQCGAGLPRTQCLQTCTHTADTCLQPLNSCTAQRADRCARAYATCAEACPPAD